jgi:hypothetical protein
MKKFSQSSRVFGPGWALETAFFLLSLFLFGVALPFFDGGSTSSLALRFCAVELADTGAGDRLVGFWLMVFFSCCCAESISVADQLRSAMVERTLSLGFFESAMLTVARV